MENRDTGSPRRLIIAAPHAGVRAGIRAALETEPDLRVVDEAEDAAGVLAAASLARPDVVFVDLSLVLEHGGDLVRAILDRSPASRVVVLSSLESESSIAVALRAGAHGHLRKDAFREELVATVREPGERSSSRSDLTPREVEILGLIARGRSNREIGEALSITEGTVKAHLHRIFHKMGVEDRTQAAIAALKRGAIRL